MSCSFYFEEDMRSLFPYINAVAEGAEFYARPPMVRFIFQKVYCVVYPDRCIAAPMAGKDEARTFVEDLVSYLESIHNKRDEISPKHTLFKPGAVPEILKLLPGNNCGDCGLKTCMAFAAMLAKQKVQPGLCPHMSRPLAHTYPVFDRQGRQVSQVTLHIDEGPNGSASPRAATGRDRQEPVARGRGPAKEILVDPLTRREIQVLALMGEGQTNPEISDHLNISPHTVKSHVVNIFNKLGVNHRTQAVVWAARQGII